MIASHMCRVTVQIHRADRSVAADLVLPTGPTVGEMLPSVVDTIGDRVTDMAGLAAERWTLSRFDGTPVDESMTLHENGVNDGDVLMLSTVDTRMAVRSDDLYHAVIDASTPLRDDHALRARGAVTCLWAAGLGAVALMWSAGAPASTRAVIAAIVAVAATAGSVMACRAAGEPLPALALGTTAAAFAAVAGFLAVPGGPAPPNFVLAAVLCCAVSIVLLQAAPSGTTCFTAIAAFTAMAAIAAVAGSIWPAPTTTVGAMLSAASLVILGMAAKLSIRLAGISPTLSNDGPLPEQCALSRAHRGHHLLTGLLTGSSASAAAGTVLVAADQRGDHAASGAALAGVVSVALLLRARQQLGALRCTAIHMAGIISATACSVLMMSAAPQHASWVAVVAVVLGVGALLMAIAPQGTRMSPVARRGLEFLEYLSLGAVVPLACWVANVFGIVRGLRLS